MNWRTLVCAACSRPVVDGTCPACRAMRHQFERNSGPRLDLVAVLAVLALILSLLLALHH